MAVSLARLPKYLVVEPTSTVRLEMELTKPSCEIDVELENPAPGRSFVLLIGRKGGPRLQRMSLSGRARIVFDPRAPGVYVLLLGNPQREPLVLRLKARNLPRQSTAPRTHRAPRSPARRAKRGRTHGPGRASAGRPRILLSRPRSRRSAHPKP